MLPPVHRRGLRSRRLSLRLHKVVCSGSYQHCRGVQSEEDAYRLYKPAHLVVSHVTTLYWVIPAIFLAMAELWIPNLEGTGGTVAAAGNSRLNPEIRGTCDSIAA